MGTVEERLWRRGDHDVSAYLVLRYTCAHVQQADADCAGYLPCSNFDFKEKAEVDKYYPQYYHKTDKVRAGSFY